MVNPKTNSKSGELSESERCRLGPPDKLLDCVSGEDAEERTVTHDGRALDPARVRLNRPVARVFRGDDQAPHRPAVPGEFLG